MEKSFILCKFTPNGDGLPDQCEKLAISADKQQLEKYCLETLGGILYEFDSLDRPIRPVKEMWEDYYKIISSEIIVLENKPNEKNVDIIKGLLKWVKAQDFDWDSDLDMIFNPNFDEKNYNPKKR